MRATGHEDGSVLLWKTSTLRRLRTLAGHEAPIVALAFSPDGAVLASGAGDGTILLRWIGAER